VVFTLSSFGVSWSESTIYNFTGDLFGNFTEPDGVTPDGAGNLYGFESIGGPFDLGSVYKMTPASGVWKKTTLHNFTGGSDGGDPVSLPVADAAGAIYGATVVGGRFGYGVVFKLALVNGLWKETVLHEFTNGNDGGYPNYGLTLDSDGNVYGTTSIGGAYGFGTAFKITP